MARDEALVDNLVTNGHSVHIAGVWENPGLASKAERSGGSLTLVQGFKTHEQIDAIAEWATALTPNMFVTNFDDALAAGVADAVRERDASILLPIPDRESAKAEADKFHLRQLVEEIDPKYNPELKFVTDPVEVDAAVNFFKDQGVEVAIKPRNLTGGKGVKVMGPHLASFEDAAAYAREVLAKPDQTGLEVQEKLSGQEFTLQVLTDGTISVEPPVIHDYPYREDGDNGLGTGGMGAFSMAPGEFVPFLNQDIVNEAMELTRNILRRIKERGGDFKGVAYPSFMVTTDGQLKIIEMNVRGGDPEYVNLIDLLENDVDMGEVLTDIANGELDLSKVRFKKAASAMVYLVAPEYGRSGSGPVIDFGMDLGMFESYGVKTRFSAARGLGNSRYQTVGTSRVVGFSALGKTPSDARALIHMGIQDAFIDGDCPLDFRNDVASKDYIENMRIAS